MSKWIAEFDLEDGDRMPKHMDLEYNGVKLDFHCRPMWIPVSERLPEEDGEYLVTTINGDVDIYVFHTWGAKSPKAIAWMPLPKSYEPKESEDKE